jgi:DNA topoisomerase-2
MKINDFFNEDFNAYSTYDSYRSLCNYVDGLKPSTRKIVYTVDADNIKSDLKVAQLISKVAEKTAYLHGEQSLEGVIVGLAQNFAGSNNINLLKPEGSFGNRTIQEAAASRYIYTCKEKIFDKIFRNEDKDVLIEQEFEGQKIEPKFFIPILPLALINGSEGIGTGFAQKILSRNPIDLIKSIKKIIKSKSPYKGDRIQPFFKDFKGDIKWNEADKNWHIYGKFERIKRATFLITELPVGYDLEKYANILNRLEDDRVISSYIDKSEDNKFLFEIKGFDDFAKNTDEWIYDKLKLIKRVSENFTCVDENNSIRVFTDEIEILNAFCKIRLEYYLKRKEFLLAEMKRDLNVLKNRYKFIYHITRDEIVLSKKTKVEIENQCEKFNLTKIDDSYNYLVNMNLLSLSKEKMEELKNAIEALQNKINILTNKTEYDLWSDDLTELEKLL